MKKIILFNTAIGSHNLGDYIINESALRGLNDIIPAGSFIVEYPTHTPTLHSYQSFRRNAHVRYADNAVFKFILGTNILALDILRPWPNWNINIFTNRIQKGSVLVGAGLGKNAAKMNAYTRLVYKNTLSKKSIHSVRDEKTKIALEQLGLKAINTGCVTLWGLSAEKCRQIPVKKSGKVVFTVFLAIFMRLMDYRYWSAKSRFTLFTAIYMIVLGIFTYILRGDLMGSTTSTVVAILSASIVYAAALFASRFDCNRLRGSTQEEVS